MTWKSEPSMTENWINPPANFENYALSNVRIPPHLCSLPVGNSGWCAADILIENSKVSAVFEAGQYPSIIEQVVDVNQGIVLSGLVDCHTHLDKAHVGAFTNFIPGSLSDAISAMAENKLTWTPVNLNQRVEFSLQTAYANGVRAMRSHVDFSPTGPDFTWDVMIEAAHRWKGKIELQLSPLANIIYFDDNDFCARIYAAAAQEGRVGMFLYNQPDLIPRLTSIFKKAKAAGWDIDLHVDEGLDDQLDGLNSVAKVALATKFQGRILCGHCVALNTYDSKRRERVIAQAVDAELHFVALPTTNLYLQDRNNNVAPQRRGMAPVRSMVEAGAIVSLGADNVRDGFSAFGDFDPITVLNLGAQIGHLHEPARDWSSTITSNPASTMGLDWEGKIETGAPADLVLFTARNSGEMNLSASAQRVVIRQGKWLKNEMPSFNSLSEEV